LNARHPHGLRNAQPRSCCRHALPPEGVKSKTLPVEPEFLCDGSQEMLVNVPIVPADRPLTAPPRFRFDPEDECIRVTGQSRSQSPAKITHGNIPRLAVLGMFQITAVKSLPHTDYFSLKSRCFS
jgi:hypothetical protein